MRTRWIAIGALAVLGTFWLFIRLMFALELWGSWVPLVGNVMAGAVAGAVIARHVAVKPWREPAIAAVVAFGIALAFWYAFPTVIDDQRPHPLTLLAVMMTVGAAIGGAALVRNYFETTPSFVVSALLDAQILGGLTMILLGLQGALGASKQAFIVLVIAAIGVAGFLTQWVTSVRRPWACSGGGLVMILIVLSGSGRDKFSAALGLMVLWCVGALGAWLQWKLGKRTEIAASVPAAKIQ